MNKIELYIERTLEGKSAVHVPSVVGGSFYTESSEEEILKRAPAEFTKFLAWYQDKGLTLPIDVASPEFVIKETLEGAPIWLSGNPVALFFSR